MQLPSTDDVDVSSLSRIFNDTTNAYKFYWFLAILDKLQTTGESRMAMRDLSLRMLATVWYPLNYYKLSFGAQDQFKDIADAISPNLTVDLSPTAPDLVSQLKNRLSEPQLAGLYRRMKGKLLRYVPYRFVRPFLNEWPVVGDDIEIKNRIIELCDNLFSSHPAKIMYRFVDNGNSIELNQRWFDYLQKHQYILRGFIHWHLVRFLQKNNPNVPAISEKLDRPVARNFKIATPFWTDYLKHNPATYCIYSGQPIATDTLSIDHYLPFSFVAHDQLWNLLPTTKTVNSAKNDRLPDTASYFDKFARLQFDAFQFHVQNSSLKKLEDYSALFRESTEAIRNHPFDWFRERLERTVIPQLQTAQNMGFPYPFIYRKS